MNITPKFIEGLHDYLGRAFKPIAQKLKQAESRLDALEAERGKNLADSYEGSYLTGKSYGRGKLVTSNGNLWLCLTDTAGRPGDTPDWKLIVRAGRDAR